jgi:nucleoside-diphosphate-sugar epimerase
MAKINKILIFGGTGFIGYHLCKKALKNKFKVLSISKNPPLKKRKLKKINYINLDATKINSFKKISRDCDIIINAAGYGSHLRGKKGKTLYNDHILIVKNIIKYFKGKTIKKIIQIGSSSEYSKHNSRINENFKANPISYYGKAKLCITKFLQNEYNRKKLPVTIFRIFQAYGPKQDENRLIPYVIKNLKNKKNVFLTNGKQIRDFCFIDDLINAIFLSINNKNTNGQVINLGSGRKIKVEQIVKKIFKKIKKGKLIFNVRDLHHGEQKIILPDISKAKKLLRWKPKILLENGLKRTIKEV